MLWKPVHGNIQLYEDSNCQLKVIETNGYMQIWINYKGYNIVMPMMMWEFDTEPMDRKINFDVAGESFENWYFTVAKEDFSLFADLIYFFLTEHDADRMINPDLVITKWP